MIRSKVILVAGALAATVSGCSHPAIEYVLNPFNDSQYYPDVGERSLRPILEEGSSGSEHEKARHALEVMGSYRRAQEPQPAYPVVQPAEIRLMWVPDHLSKQGDLVPAHYYFLKVIDDRWAVQDAFDYQQQLNSGTTDGPGSGSATPYIDK